jgi:bacterioferritin-associated ferredoxin
VHSETESQKQKAKHNVIICICRGKNERHVARAIEDGATSIADLQRCGIGDQCGSCHVNLRAMLAQAAAEAAMPCPAHVPDLPAAALSHA